MDNVTIVWEEKVSSTITIGGGTHASMTFDEIVATVRKQNPGLSAFLPLLKELVHTDDPEVNRILKRYNVVVDTKDVQFNPKLFAVDGTHDTSTRDAAQGLLNRIRSGNGWSPTP